MNKTIKKNAKEKCLNDFKDALTADLNLFKKQKKQKKNRLAKMSDKQFINAMNIQ